MAERFRFNRLVLRPWNRLPLASLSTPLRFILLEKLKSKTEADSPDFFLTSIGIVLFVF
jgi:hypothetical protein